MTISSTKLQNEQLWYLEFSENQLLRALAHLSDNTHDPKVRACMSAHMEEVGDLIERRKQFFHDLKSVAEIKRAGDGSEAEP